MLKSEHKDLWISWEEYHRAIELLALKIHDSDFKFDHILCLARGGLRIGDVFSRLFKLPLSILSVSSYRGEAGQDQGAIKIGGSIASVEKNFGGRVLLVDDLVDSGVTFREVQPWLRDHYPEITEVKSAVIWVKSSSVVIPDFYLTYLEDSPWIHQPFELYDTHGLEKIRT
ncbi:phosphoribosyltransferase [Undibacterium fentianense]|uniref:Phosphoribosyltransferase n=1 Tax=Undibacterium fentianense TaxID=2828728 RepID=A0A941IDQ7_9BURK|nr:phosphoribosyltransferase family protein [Undibacterium fentianense]MBR7798826.1 phosphoribosyltransferase [Undibacterium fentianense]